MTVGPDEPGAPPAPTIQPAPRDWAGALARSGAASSERAAQFRKQLRLPTDRPIVLTGHQAAIWHPGILAKYLAADAASHAFGAAPAWLIVDHDTNDYASIRFPVRTAAGRFEARTWAAAPGIAPHGGERERPPARNAPAFHPTPIPDVAPAAFAARSIAPGLARIHEALDAHAGAPSAARQLASALADLMAPLIPAAPTVLATDLARTDLFADLLARLRADPGACVRAYNAAAAAHPHARIAALTDRPGTSGLELPLWHIPAKQGSLRRRVHSEMLASIPAAELAPRALLITGLARLAACDLFIHGTGGGGAAEGEDHHEGYDRVTEDWLTAWLGQTLAPVAVVTATLRLPFDADPVSPAAAAHARWLAHHARHNPAALGDPTAAALKRELLGQIHAARKAGQSPAPAFAQMHDLLARARAVHADRLADLDSTADAMHRRLADAAVINDRTWPFPLYDPRALLALRNAISSQFGAP